MFFAEHWAAAFVDSAVMRNTNVGGCIEALEVLASHVKKIPGPVFGSAAAFQLERLLHQAAGSVSGIENIELGIRLTVLLVRKNLFHHMDAVIDAAKKIEAKRNGIVNATMEYASPPGINTTDSDALQTEELRIKDAIRKRTGALSVEIDVKINPELIGGFRLRIGDEVIDSSVRSQIKQLQACLSGGGN